MRVMHFGDEHAKEDAYELLKASVDTMIAEHRRKAVDLFVSAGDWWNGPIQNADKARFNDFQELIRRLAECAPIAMVYGYRHDMVGSLEVFESMHTTFSVRILRPGKAYYLGSNAGDLSRKEIRDYSIEGRDEALLFGVPEPTKEWLLASGGATGKDASDLAIRDRLRALLLGLGGLRRQHPDLPCVLVYHGDIYGATTSVGYSTAAGTGIAVARDDLAAVGADYYALGHIHLPQQIPGIPAYYCGKAYTGNWNERDYIPGANIAEIDPEGIVPTLVSRLDFPHPMRVKFSVTLEEFDNTNWKPKAEGKMVWIEITGTREGLADVNAEFMSADIVTRKDFLALEGSLVTLDIIPTETIRAGEIAKKGKLAEKVQLQGENSSTPYPESVLKKARDLELEVGRIDQLSGPARRFRNVSTFLRGSKGFYRKQKKDEVVIDWESYGEGVIAYVGPNGFGKTTSFDFSKPWAEPTARRPKTLQKHFRLKDSVIENVYLEEISGVRYRSLINIDGANKTGNVEYFLFREENGKWEPFGDTNGRQKPYFEAVDSLFGSMAIYLRTACIQQKPTKDFPDIGEATQEEKKALIAKLAGKDFAPYQAAANAKGKVLDTEIIRLDAIVDAAAGVDESMAKLANDIETQLKAEAEAVRAEKESTERGKVLAAEKDALQLRVAELDRKVMKKGEIEKEIQELQEAITEAQEAEGVFSMAAEGRGAAEKELADLKDLEAKAQKLYDEKAVIDQENLAAAKAYREAVAVYDAARKRAQGAADLAKDMKAKAERELATARARLSAPIIDHCPTCNQLLPTDTLALLKEGRAKNEAEVKGLEERIEKLIQGVQAAEKVLADLEAPESAEPKPFPGAAELAEVEADGAMIDAAAAQEILRKAGEAEIRIEESRKRRAEKAARIEAARKELEALGDPANSPDRNLLIEKLAEYESERSAYTKAREDVARAKASLDAARHGLEEAEQRKAARDDAAAKRLEKVTDRDEWAVLEKAIEGVRDLELDALAPSIAEIATRLLKSSGDNGQIEIETTRISSGSAKKARQIEDFLIFYTAEDGEQQDIATCSGGEMVWQRRALYSAFGVIRSKNAGIKFVTQLLDETDGALHPARKMDYFRMLEAAHKESGAYQTFLITQSSEVAAMAASTINVADLGPRKDAQGVAA